MKNNTIYAGTPYLDFDKNPHWVGKSVLNKIHLDLGIVKLVSRVSNYFYDTDKIRRICEYHDADLVFVTWDDKSGEFYHKVIDVMNLDKKFTRRVDGGFFSLLLKNGETTGIDDAFYFYKNRYRLLSHGTAKKDDEMVYLGYSHRGSCQFRIGDALFDENWEAEKYSEWSRAFEKRNQEASAVRRMVDIVPFNMRGYRKCVCRDDLETAAKNFSKYIG